MTDINYLNILYFRKRSRFHTIMLLIQNSYHSQCQPRNLKKNYKRFVRNIANERSSNRK